MTDKFVLWGFHPAYINQPIRLSGADSARDLRLAEKSRKHEGFLTAIYKSGDGPDGLIAQIAELLAMKSTNEKTNMLYKLGVNWNGNAWKEILGIDNRTS